MTVIKAALEAALSKGVKAGTPTVHDARKERLEYIPVDQIDVVKNVRKTFNQTRLEELAASVAANGVIQPLVVRVIAGRFKLVAGERRWRAAQMAGLKDVPCVVRDMGDAKALEAQLVENTHREQMNAVDEAFGVKELHEKLNLTQQVTAERLGKSEFYISQQIALTGLPRRALEALRRGVINRAGAYELTKIAKPADRAAVIEAVLPEGGKTKWEGRHVSAAKIKSVVRALRAHDQSPPQRVRTPSGETSAERRKHWRYWLLQLAPQEFTYFLELCQGRYDADVMAEAVDKIIGERRAAAAQDGRTKRS
jgi:ParB/RepB/Spo0J family partition protein